MRFVGDGEDIPTERPIRLENIIDALYETWPTDMMETPSKQDAPSKGDKTTT